MLPKAKVLRLSPLKIVYISISVVMIVEFHMGSDEIQYIPLREFEVGQSAIYEAKCQFSTEDITSLEYCHLFAQPKVFNPLMRAFIWCNT